ncbi:succinate dehydrogenase assembly factor 2 [Aliikangiella maris]|uniref:Succinate dehydrogenase assembly factor 2 n=2 Tax=Aliikangiella maris TaxID=3162458 RepID=A0ABV3MJE7_9GAMM
MNEPHLKNRLAWQCRRGMLELDVILIPFLEQHFDSLTSQQQIDFADLLTQADPDLYTWIMGYGNATTQTDQQMVDIIRDKMNITS